MRRSERLPARVLPVKVSDLPSGDHATCHAPVTPGTSVAVVAPSARIHNRYVTGSSPVENAMRWPSGEMLMKPGPVANPVPSGASKENRITGFASTGRVVNWSASAMAAIAAAAATPIHRRSRGRDAGE